MPRFIQSKAPTPKAGADNRPRGLRGWLYSWWLWLLGPLVVLVLLWIILVTIAVRHRPPELPPAPPVKQR